MREYFDLELKALNDKLIEMGALVEGAIKNTITIITNGEYDKLETSRIIEEKINKMEREIQSYCLNLLLLQSPVAGDLRTVSAALKMITDLERIGDQAIDIAVTRITGIFFVDLSFLNFSSTDNPSKSGSITSRITSCGFISAHALKKLLLSPKLLTS